MVCRRGSPGSSLLQSDEASLEVSHIIAGKFGPNIGNHLQFCTPPTPGSRDGQDRGVSQGTHNDCCTALPRHTAQLNRWVGNYLNHGSQSSLNESQLKRRAKHKTHASPLKLIDKAKLEVSYKIRQLHPL